MSTDIDTANHRTGTPTRTSTVLSLVIGLAVVGLLLWRVDLVLAPVLVGSAGALCFAAGLWLVGLDRWVPVARGLAGLLALPVTLGLLVAILGTVLLIASTVLPVDSQAGLSLLSLTVITKVGVVAGCVFAVLGILLGVRNIVDEESVTAYFWVSVQTAVVPGIVGLFLATGAILTQQELGIGGAGFIDDFVRWVFVPGRLQTHLGTVFLLVALAAAALRAALDALPVAELIGDSGTGETDHWRISQLRTALQILAFGTAALCGVAFLVETIRRPIELQQLLGLGLYGTLTDLSTAPGLRSLLVVIIVAATGIWLGSVGLQRMATSSTRAALRRTGPFVAGGLITVGGIAFGRPIVETFISEVGWRLPAPFDEVFFSYATDVVDFFGPPPLVLTAAFLLLGMTVSFLLCFRLAVFAGYLSDESAGYSLASGGLFVAAAFAGTLATEAWVLFAALVGVFFVWDMGRYGTTMGSEIGRHASTRDAELVHAGGTLGVGLLGVGAAYGLQRLLAMGAVEQTPVAVIALVGALAGIIFLVTALR
ncbi:DUF7519 family protein [Salinibaculum salinum]|uniref:DUF7519 family protein n=1 Tax=Salinibaculum salinum TaxID=3131996 RepID=UPI0030EF1995